MNKLIVGVALVASGAIAFNVLRGNAEGSTSAVALVGDTTPAACTAHRSFLSRQVNMTIVSDRPTATLQRLEALLKSSEGTVQNASSSDTGGYLQASFPPGTSGAFAAAIAESMPISNTSTSSNDMGAEMKRLCQRHEALRRVDSAIRTQITDGEAAELLDELHDNEKRNVVSQLQSYESQADRDYVYINVQPPPAPPVTGRW